MFIVALVLTKKVQIDWIFINWWMDKQTVIYTYNGILFSFEKESSTNTCQNVDES